MHRPLFLIGFMACGKSTLLRALSQRVPGRRYVDLDHEIVRIAGKSIPAIFAEDGEEAFRRRCGMRRRHALSPRSDGGHACSRNGRVA